MMKNQWERAYGENYDAEPQSDDLKWMELAHINGLAGVAAEAFSIAAEIAEDSADPYDSYKANAIGVANKIRAASPRISVSTQSDTPNQCALCATDQTHIMSSICRTQSEETP